MENHSAAEKVLVKEKKIAMDAITEKVAKTLKLTKFDLDNTTIVGNEDAAKEIQEKAAQFDHLTSLTNGKVLSFKTSREKIQYFTRVFLNGQLINVVSISKFHDI